MLRLVAVAALGAAVAVLGLFLPWYEITGGLTPGQLQTAHLLHRDLHVSGWEYNSTLDILLALACLAGVVAAIASRPEGVMTAGLVGAALVIGRLLDGPDSARVPTRIGIWLSLVGTLVLLLAGIGQRYYGQRARDSSET